jgi:hypothetical protein
MTTENYPYSLSKIRLRIIEKRWRKRQIRKFFGEISALINMSIATLKIFTIGLVIYMLWALFH